MSLGSRIVIGLFSLFGALGMVFVALQPGGAGSPVGLYAFALFCLFISLACLGGKVGNVALRLVGAAVFLACVAYGYSEATASQVVLDSGRRSQPSVLNALIAFVIYGIPGGWFALFGGRFARQNWVIDPAFLKELAFATMLTDASANRELEWFAFDGPFTDIRAALARVEGLGAPERVDPLSEVEARAYFEELLSELSDSEEYESVDQMFADLQTRVGGRDGATYYRVTYAAGPFGFAVMGIAASGLLLDLNNDDDQVES